MSVQRKILALQNLIRARPAYANIPIVVVNGTPMTARELLARLQRGEMVAEIVSALTRVGLDPQPEQYWQLAQAYYERLAREAPTLRIVCLGRILSPAEAAEEIRKRTPVGQTLVQTYMKLLAEMGRLIR